MHACWWTRRAESEVGEDGISVFGAGLPSPVLARTAGVLGTSLSSRPSVVDEYGEEIVLGSVASGRIHDGCFIELCPPSPELKHAVVMAMLGRRRKVEGR